MMPTEVSFNKCMYQICSLIIRAQDEDEFWQHISQQVCEVFEAQCCSIWMSGVNGIGQQRISFSLVQEKLKDYLPSLDFQAANLTMAKHKTYFWHNVLKDNDFTEAKNEKLILTVCPLNFKSQRLGVLCLWADNEVGQKPDEFGAMLNKVADEIAVGLYNYKYYSNASRKRVNKELEIARQIQLDLAPSDLPDIKGVSLGARTIAANEVGGDYLDLFFTHNKKLGIAVGDVMGKGVPAALWMAMTRVALRMAAFENIQPQIALHKINKVLYPDISAEGMFVTLLYGIYDAVNKTLLFSNAGHLPPLLFRKKTGAYELLKVKGAYIGGVANKSYKLGGVQLEKGDVVLFYTDGLTEAMNGRDEQMGIKRVADVISKNCLYQASEIVDCLSLHLGQFVGNHRQSDDITFAVLKIE